MDKLDIKLELKNLIEQTLLVAEYTSSSDYNYNKFRQRFLRLSNNIIRRLDQEVNE